MAAAVEAVSVRIAARAARASRETGTRAGDADRRSPAGTAKRIESRSVGGSASVIGVVFDDRIGQLVSLAAGRDEAFRDQQLAGFGAPAANPVADLALRE